LQKTDGGLHQRPEREHHADEDDRTVGSDFLQYTEDNCTPSGQLVTASANRAQGTGFPTNPDGTPQKNVTFTCDELGTQLVELWSIDLAGNADYCETYVIVQDNMGNCDGNSLTVAGALKTESQTV
jgi:hypothetical protein